MTLRSVIDIDVNDGEFKRFEASFKEHQKAVQSLPAAWQKVGKETDAIKDGFADMVAALMTQNKLLHAQTAERERGYRAEDAARRKQAQDEREAANRQRQADRDHQKSLEERQRLYKQAVKDTQQIARNVGSATLDLMKWVGLGAVGGFAALGGLAGSVSGSFRTAQGLGTSTGSMQALGVNYGRFFDAQSVLGNIAGAQSDLSKRWVFNSMGIDPTGNPADIAVKAAVAAKGMFERGGMTQQYADASGLTQIFTMEELRRLHAATMRDLNSAGSGYGRDARALGMSDRTQRAWQNFHYELARAGTQIKNVLAEGLVPLVPALRDFTQAVADTIKTFLSNPKLKDWIKSVGDGLKTFAEYVATDEFQNKVKSFVTNFGIVCDKIAAGLRVLGIIPSGATGAGASGTGDIWTDLRNVQLDAREPTGKRRASAAGIMSMLQSLGWSRAQAAGLAANIEAESGFNPMASGDKGAAYGLGQWHSDRQAAYAHLFGHSMQSVTNPYQAMLEQVKFINHELTRGGERRAGQMLKHTLFAAEAGQTASMFYERPYARETEAKRRGERAQVLVNVQAQTGAGVSVQASQLPQ